jgi:hypothetical protein
MDNSLNLNNGSNSMYPSSSLNSSISSSSNSTITSSNSFLDTIKNISIFTWVIIFFILAFLGFNIFIYLAKGTQDITNFFSPIINYFIKLFGGVTSQVVDVSAEGAKEVVDTAANITTSGLSAVQQTTPGGLKTTPVQTTIPQADIMQTNTLNKALNSSTSEKQKSSTDYEADESTSTIQNGASKSGWCYIGEDRGFRSCAKVGVDDKCMSGEIFPSNEICINPNLRA